MSNGNDLQSLRAFLSDAQRKAEVILGAEHLGEDVKIVIRDLLQVSKNFENLIQDSNGQQSDLRLLKKRLDQAKSAARADEGKIEAVRGVFLILAEEIKAITFETAQILKRNETVPASSDAASASKIKASAQKMVGVIVKTLQAD
jgi:hypothetical protein